MFLGFAESLNHIWFSLRNMFDNLLVYLLNLTPRHIWHGNTLDFKGFINITTSFQRLFFTLCLTLHYTEKHGESGTELRDFISIV